MKIVSNVDNLENLKALVRQDLRDLGIKVPKIKKNKRHSISKQPQDFSKSSGVFGNFLSHVCCVHVTDCGYVPKFLVEAGDFILKHVNQEGIFRKSGAVSRQKELKQQIEEGKGFVGANVYDVASLVKQFFRELPEPLFTSVYHDTFIRCFQLEDQDKSTKALLLVCLLLPGEHVSTLRFVLMLLAKVAQFSDKNKMDIANLSVVLAPNLLHINNKSEKMNSNEEKLLQVQTSLVEFLIKNADDVGTISENLAERAAFMKEVFGTDDELEASEDNLEESKEMGTKSKEKKRKRSGSFQGFVSSIAQSISKWRRSTEGKLGNSSNFSQSNNSTNMSQGSTLTQAGSKSDDNLVKGIYQFSATDVTPVVKKRKTSNEAVPFSASKKQAILHTLPRQATLGHTPFTPASSFRKIEISDPICHVATPGIPYPLSRANILATPRNVIQTPRKKINLFSPSSNKKKRRGSTVNLSVQSTGRKQPKTKGIFRRFSGSREDQIPKELKITHVGQRLASPLGGTEDQSLNNLPVNFSAEQTTVNESPMAAILQNSSLSSSFCEQSIISMCNAKPSYLNEGFMVSGDDVDAADISRMLAFEDKSKSLVQNGSLGGEYVVLTNVAQNSPDTSFSSQQTQNLIQTNHEKPYMAEISLNGSMKKSSLRRGQPNSIKTGLLNGDKKEINKLRRSFGLDKSDISNPIPIAHPSVSQSMQSLNTSPTKSEVEGKVKEGRSDFYDSPGSVSQTAATDVVNSQDQSAGKNVMNCASHEAGHDSDEESEAGFSTISGGTAIFIPNKGSLNVESNTSKCADFINKALSTKDSQSSIVDKCKLKESLSVDSLFSEPPETSPTSEHHEMKRSLSTDSGKGSMFDEQAVEDSSENLIQNEPVEETRSNNSAFDQSAAGDKDERSASKDPSLEEGDGSFSEYKDSDVTQPKKSLSSRNLKTLSQASVTRSHSLFVKSLSSHKSNMKPKLQISLETHKLLARAGYIKDRTVPCDKFDIEVPSSAFLAPLKQNEEINPRRESIIALQTYHKGRVASTVRQFDKVCEEQDNDVFERHSSPLRFVNATSRKRWMSPLNLPTDLVKGGKDIEKYRDVVNISGQQRLQKGTALLPISTTLLKPSEDATNMETPVKSVLMEGGIKRKPSIYYAKEKTLYRCSVQQNSEKCDNTLSESMNKGAGYSSNREASILENDEMDVDIVTYGKTEQDRQESGGIFDGQSFKLSQSLEETINEVCTPLRENVSRCSEGTKSPDKENTPSQNAHGISEERKDTANRLPFIATPLFPDNLTLRTASGKTPREVLKVVRSSIQVKRLGSSQSPHRNSPRKKASSPNSVYGSSTRAFLYTIPDQLQDNLSDL
ncbi:hypothetical protein ACJMK2_036150 [Sinanodonta woodiana]|uniref:Rho-GAP domain-containing protein n=1 Tax=Sinanodonta woodiana TaxID=1069815 RepID=A0ABD3WHL6_SINWO